MSKKIIVITGLTASGKTELSIQLAKTINAEIICADSRIIYKNLDIVSAKPTNDERKGIIHHLIDIIEPVKDFSAGDFVTLASKIIDNTNKNIIISGGTWFYIKSLLNEYSLLDCPRNNELRNDLEKLSNQELWNKLNELDLKRAKLVHQNNRDKVIRSIEMCIYYQKPISEVKREENKKYDSVWFMPDFEREDIYKRIDKRVDNMIDKGLFEEWKQNDTLYPDSKILKNTIGYSEFYDFEYKEAIDKIKQHTRNFAKRQITYFKTRQDIIKIKSLDDILNKISNLQAF